MEKNKLSAVFTGACLCMSLLGGCYGGAANGGLKTVETVLRGETAVMETNGDFRIITVTDSHLNGPNGEPLLERILDPLIENFAPDLIVLNGDNVDEHISWENENTHLKYLKKLGEYFEAKGQYWAATLGNHDRDRQEGGVPLGLKAQNDLLVGFGDGTFGERCLYRQSEPGYEDALQWNTQTKQDAGLNEWYRAKYGNYTVSVTENGKTVYSLFFLDSGQHSSPGSPDNGYIEDYQVEFYKNRVVGLSEERYGAFDLGAGKYVPSMIFLHQPLPEYVFAAQAALGASGKGTVPARYGYGQNGESPTLVVQREGVNKGLFAAAKNYGGTDFFAGHNHDNNSSILYGGVRLHYLNRVGRRDNEASSWTESRINFSKMITIKAGTREVITEFALHNGETTLNHAYAAALPVRPL